MNIVDKLLTNDKLTEKPTMEVEIKRFSKALGEPCLFKIQAVETKKLREISELNTKTEYVSTKDKNGRVVKEKKETTDRYKTIIDTIVESVVDPDFRDSRLREKYKTQDPAEIVEKMLLVGEIELLNNKINEINELNNDTQTEVDEEIKN